MPTTLATVTTVSLPDRPRVLEELEELGETDPGKDDAAEGGPTETGGMTPSVEAVRADNREAARTENGGCVAVCDEASMVAKKLAEAAEVESKMDSVSELQAHDKPDVGVDCCIEDGLAVTNVVSVVSVVVNLVSVMVCVR